MDNVGAMKTEAKRALLLQQYRAKWFAIAAFLAFMAGFGPFHAAQAQNSPYAAAVLADGPLVYYRFEETAGTAVANLGSLGAAKNGTYAPQGVTLARPSAFPSLGKAAGLDGSRGFVGVPQLSPGTFPEFTIEFWVNRSPKPANVYTSLFASEGFESGEIHFNLITAGPKWQVGVSGASGTVQGPAPLPPDKWRHVALTYQVDAAAGAATAKLYVDGDLAGEGTSSATPARFNASRIGAWFDNANTSRYLDGAVDEFAVYDHALTAAAIRQHRDAALGNGILPTVFYSADFEGTIGLEWSQRKGSTTPTGGRKYLGDFGNQTATLTASNLPPHSAGTVDFDLFLLRSWDGNNKTVGPDVWTLQLTGLPALLKTTFGNGHPLSVGDGQAYPGTSGQGVYPAQTGATEINTLGYVFNDAARSGAMDAVYHLSYSFAHSATDKLPLQFLASGLQALTDESWGLDNVQIKLFDAPAGILDIGAPLAQIRENGGSVAVQVNRVGGSAGTVSANYTTVAGTAQPDADYTAAAGTLTFADGETSKTVVIPILDNTRPENDRSFRFVLSDPSPNTALARESESITIFDDDGRFQFTQAQYLLREGTTGVNIQVEWIGAGNRTVSVDYTTRDGTAKSSGDYSATSGTLTFQPGQTSKNLFVSVRDDTVPEPDEVFYLRLQNPNTIAALPNPPEVPVWILDNDEAGAPGRAVNWQIQALAVQPDGKILIGGGFNQVNTIGQVGIARLNADGSTDTGFSTGGDLNNWVENIALQPDGKILIAGSFTTIKGTARNRIARLNANGSLDTTFNPGGGANGTVYEVLALANGKILIAGNFTQFNGVAVARVARLNANGTLDDTFSVGAGPTNPPAGAGWDPIIWAAAEQADGKIILSGEFATFNGAARKYIARINADGSLENTFNIGTGLNGIGNVAVVLGDGKILLGGWFTSYNGVARNRILRLNSNGTLDTAFNPSGGADATPWSLAVQPDGKVLVAGGFRNWNGVNRGGIVRLNANGSLDTTFAVGSGANGYIGGVGVLPDGRVAIAGFFDTVNGFNRERFALLNPDGTQPPEAVKWIQWKTADGGNGHFYALTSQPGTWVQTEAEAIAQFGHLATITSAAEQTFLQDNFLHGLDRLRPFWIGLNDAAAEGKFVWPGGDPLIFTAWNADSPKTKPSGEDYVALNWSFSAKNGTAQATFGLWSDLVTGGSFTPAATPSDGPYFGIMETDGAAKTPVIGTPPVSGVALAGGTWQFEVRATGEGPLTYAWQKDGAPIPNATEAILKLSSLGAADEGKYTVTVSNFFGATPSAPAQLRVVTAPRIETSAISYQGGTGITLKLAVPLGVRFVVEASEDLRSWQTVMDSTSAELTTTVVDSASTTLPARFYRLKYLLSP